MLLLYSIVWSLQNICQELFVCSFLDCAVCRIAAVHFCIEIPLLPSSTFSQTMLEYCLDFLLCVINDSKLFGSCT